VAFVVGTTTGGTGAHVWMLAVGLANRGIDVSVVGPSAADAVFGFGALDGVTFSPVEFGDRPRVSDAAALLQLRRLLRGRTGGAANEGAAVGTGGARAAAAGDIRTITVGDSRRPDVVHAHGLRAGALSALALVGAPARARRRRRSLMRTGAPAPNRPRPALVVTVHNAPPAGGGAPALIYRLLERIVARRADLVLCVSADLEARMRSASARQVARAVVPSPTPPAASTTSTRKTSPVSATPSVALPPPQPAAPSGLSATGRPVVLAVGRLAAQKGFDVLLDAAARWRDLDPLPLLAIAGDGALAGKLRGQAASLGIDAAFLGRRDDVPDLLAAAAVFVLPSRWEGQPLILQEALRAGAAIVATRAGGIPDLVGDDAALLVAPDDAPALAAAVRAVLTDDSLAVRLRAAASRRAPALPTADEAIAAALAAYAQVTNPT
jgi:glycosyltransferase involved in cell wall biosynthesis